MEHQPEKRCIARTVCANGIMQSDATYTAKSIGYKRKSISQAELNVHGNLSEMRFRLDDIIIFFV